MHELSLSERGRSVEVGKMKKCLLCNKMKPADEILGIYCLRCEKIQTDVQEDLAREFILSDSPRGESI